MYNFATPQTQLKTQDLLTRPLIKRLLGTRAVDRLSSIRFLGAIDYTIYKYPRATVSYNRLQHSIGVMALCANAAEERDPSKLLLWSVAGLLHDIGHAPFSHSIESVFVEHFGMNHHKATHNIIKGESPYKKEVSSILKEYHIDVDHVLHILGKGDKTTSFMFGDTINLDTIEGVSRTLHYDNILLPVNNIAKSLVSNNTAQYRDYFWTYKALAYRKIIQSKEGLISDYAMKSIVVDNLERIDKDAFYMTDVELIHAIPALVPFLSGKTKFDELKVKVKRRIFELIDSPDNRYVERVYSDEL